MSKYILEKGDLGNGFSLNRDLEITMKFIPKSMGFAVLYAVRIGSYDFEGCSFDDVYARKILTKNIVGMYQHLEEVSKTERLASRTESLRKELSDLITSNNQKRNKK